jgi:hypothetical protein
LPLLGGQAPGYFEREVAGRTTSWLAGVLGYDDEPNMAIAVVIVAFLVALMWLGFKSMWDTTEQKTDEEIEQISG